MVSCTHPYTSMYSQSLLGDLPRDHRNGTSTGNHTLQVLPSPSNSSTVLLQQLLQRYTHLFLHHTRVVDVSTDTKHLCSGIPLPSKSSKPRSTSSSNRGRHSNRLDICHGRRTTEQSYIGREWRLESWFTLFTLDGFDQSGFFSANVCSGTPMQVDVERVSCPTRVFSDESSFVSLVDGLLDVRCFLVELSSDVDVG